MIFGRLSIIREPALFLYHLTTERRALLASLFDGSKLYVDPKTPHGSGIMSTGIYEADVTYFVKRYLSAGMMAFDIGQYRLLYNPFF